MIAFVCFITLIIKTAGDPEFTKNIANQRINDITELNAIQVQRIVKPKTPDEIRNAIKNSTGSISIGGGKYSMGGQTAFENSLHFDLRDFNKVIRLDTISKTVTVQAGITWNDLQQFIDPYNLSIKIMQTYANFTVGGAVSVNCHGRYIGHGPIISSVLELEIITSDGNVIKANRALNTDIFNAAIGGYGGIGIITNVTLQLEDNVKVKRKVVKMDAIYYNSFFQKNIKNNPNVVFQNADLYPPHYSVLNNVSWEKTNDKLTDDSRLKTSNETYWLEPKLLELVSYGDLGKWIREVIVDPLVYSSEEVRWRNKEANYDVAELEPSSRKEDTYVLQEYFIPVNNINSFIPKMKAIFDKYDVNVINVSLRHAHSDKESYLSWAQEEVFAFVVYYKQGTDSKAKSTVKKWTVEITDAILSEKGTWYLPYQPHATVIQFNKAYPNANIYFEVKKQLDPKNRFTNKLLDKYNPNSDQKFKTKTNKITGYVRSEEQTFLTIPEWYLVFNPKEYADYLEKGKNPSDFPFFASINEYWTLYDRSMTLVSNAYPANSEYKMMLDIIGISVTVEYTLKSIYENTIGKLFGYFSNGNFSEQEKVINQAHRAYSDFIYHTAWYEFDFLPWIKKVWAVSDTSESSSLRKWERTFLFTTEFLIKSGYAQLLESGEQMMEGETVTDIYVLVDVKSNIPNHKNIKPIYADEKHKVIGITRWGPFTETLKELANTPISIYEIGTNDLICVSAIVTKSATVNYKNATVLFDSKIVTDSNLTRKVYLVSVKNVLPFIQYLKQNNIEVEHVYDY